MLKLNALLIIYIASVITANPILNLPEKSRFDPRVNYGNANKFIDLLLWRVNRKLPDVIPIADINGAFELTDCYIIGLENGLKRNDDATVIIVGNDARFTSEFRMEHLGLQCIWHQWPVHGNVSATTDRIIISTGLSWILAEGEHPWITEFRVVTLVEPKSNVTGLAGGLNWTAEKILNQFLEDYTDEMIYAIEHQVRDALQDILNQIVIP